jgi:hypothetical protein
MNQAIYPVYLDYYHNDGVYGHIDVPIPMQESSYYDPSNEFPSPGTYNPPINRHYIAVDLKHLKLDNKEFHSLIRKVIGKEGKAFKAITHQTGADYIFFNDFYKLIEIWGFEHTLTDAANRINERINRFLVPEVPEVPEETGNNEQSSEIEAENLNSEI